MNEPTVLSQYPCSTFRLEGTAQTTFLLIHQVQPQASKHVSFSLSPAISCCQCVNIKDECRSIFPGRCLFSLLMHDWALHVNSIMMSMNPKCSANSLGPGESLRTKFQNVSNEVESYFVLNPWIWSHFSWTVSSSITKETINMQSGSVESFYGFIKLVTANTRILAGYILKILS